MLLDPTNKPDPEVCAQDLIDFSPVYRCLHIHSVLVRSGLLPRIQSQYCIHGKYWYMCMMKSGIGWNVATASVPFCYKPFYIGLHFNRGVYV